MTFIMILCCMLDISGVTCMAGWIVINK
jgi:hypothetical protein